MLVLRLLVMVLSIICLMDGHAEVSSSTTGMKNGGENSAIKSNMQEVGILERKKKKKPKKSKKQKKGKKPKPKKPSPPNPVTTTPPITTSTHKTTTATITTSTIMTTSTKIATTIETTTSTASTTTTIPTTTMTTVAITSSSRTTAATTADSGGECKATNGKPCIFPFKDGNKDYNECKNHGGKYFWCATEVYDSGKYKYWSYCPKDGPCPREGEGECRATDNKPCVFPFKDGEKEYNKCADFSGKYFWCATGTNSAGKYTGWSKCPKDGSCPLTGESTTPQMIPSATVDVTTSLITGTTTSTNQKEEKVLDMLGNLVLGESRDDSLEMVHMLDKKLDTIINDLEGEKSKIVQINSASGNLNLTLKQGPDFRDGPEVGKGLMFDLSTVDSMKSVSCIWCLVSVDCCSDCRSEYPDTELSEYWETLDTCFCYKKKKNTDGTEVEPKTRISSEFTTKLCESSTITTTPNNIEESVSTDILIHDGDKMFSCKLDFTYQSVVGFKIKSITSSLCSEISTTNEPFNNFDEYPFDIITSFNTIITCKMNIVIQDEKSKLGLATKAMEKSLNCMVDESECVTVDGESFPKPCVFPFMHQGRKYQGCTDQGSKEVGKLWCATTVDGNQEMTSWGYCSAVCGYCGGKDATSQDTRTDGDCGYSCLIAPFAQMEVNMEGMNPKLLYDPGMFSILNTLEVWNELPDFQYRFLKKDYGLFLTCPSGFHHFPCHKAIYINCTGENNFNVYSAEVSRNEDVAWIGELIQRDIQNTHIGCGPCPLGFNYKVGYETIPYDNSIWKFFEVQDIETCGIFCYQYDCSTFIYSPGDKICELSNLGIYNPSKPLYKDYYVCTEDIKDPCVSENETKMFEISLRPGPDVPTAGKKTANTVNKNKDAKIKGDKGQIKPTPPKKTGKQYRCYSYNNPSNPAQWVHRYMWHTHFRIPMFSIAIFDKVYQTDTKREGKFLTDENYDRTFKDCGGSALDPKKTPPETEYRNQRGDRGHLIASQMILRFFPEFLDVGDIKRVPQTAMLMSNIWPQDACCNQDGVWKQVEDSIVSEINLCFNRNGKFFLYHGLLHSADKTFGASNDIQWVDSVYVNYCCLTKDDQTVVDVEEVDPDAPGSSKLRELKRESIITNPFDEEQKDSCIELKSGEAAYQYYEDYLKTFQSNLNDHDTDDDNSKIIKIPFIRDQFGCIKDFETDFKFPDTKGPGFQKN